MIAFNELEILENKISNLEFKVSNIETSKRDLLHQIELLKNDKEILIIALQE